MGSLCRFTLIYNTSPLLSMQQCVRYKSMTTTLTSPAVVGVVPPIYRALANKSICSINVRSSAISAVGLSYANGQRSNYSHDVYNILRNENLNLQQQQQREFSLLQPFLRKLIRQQQFRQFSTQKFALENKKRIIGDDKEQKLFCRPVTKNLTLYTKTSCDTEIDPKTLEFKKPTGNPLVLIMAWLMARQKHLRKYAELYTELGFDVMVVHVTPWQLLWPTKGTQIVAADTLNFLENNKSYSPIIMHGFSVGAYQFGEMMLMMSQDMPRYQPILDRFVCQVWDSAADITEIPVGLPKSIFPKNLSMQKALRSYTMYHMKTFYNQATVHYVRSSQMFHSTLLKAPAIFFLSENDPIGPPSSNQSVREDWESLNIPVTFKCWDRSVHAAHMMKHRDEYLELLYKHLEASGVLGSAGLKSRANL